MEPLRGMRAVWLLLVMLCAMLSCGVRQIEQRVAPLEARVATLEQNLRRFWSYHNCPSSRITSFLELCEHRPPGKESSTTECTEMQWQDTLRVLITQPHVVLYLNDKLEIGKSARKYDLMTLMREKPIIGPSRLFIFYNTLPPESPFKPAACERRGVANQPARLNQLLQQRATRVYSYLTFSEERPAGISVRPPQSFPFAWTRKFLDSYPKKASSDPLLEPRTPDAPQSDESYACSLLDGIWVVRVDC